MGKAPALAALLVAATACGTPAPRSVFAPVDGGASPSADAGPDGPFGCGDMTGVTCQLTQYCVVGCSGGPIECAAALDGGACPAGSAPSGDCPDDASPCASGSFYPTQCVDELDASPCPNPSQEAPRTYRCNCPI